jgi:hypothetical protein
MNVERVVDYYLPADQAVCLCCLRKKYYIKKRPEIAIDCRSEPVRCPTC